MEKNKKTIIALILGFFVLAGLFAAILKILKDIPANSEAFISQKKELALLENKTKGLQEFEKEYKINAEGLDKIDKLFINFENPVDFINFLNYLRNTAADSGVSINIFPPSPKKEASGSPWPSITFQVSGSGRFLNLMRFLEKIENSPYLIEISGLSAKITKGDEKKISQDEINATLSLTVFAQ